MNKIKLATIGCLLLLLNYQISIGQQNDIYTLNCQFEGLPNNTRVYLTTQEQDTIKSTNSIGNKFKFQGSQKPEGRFYFINFDTTVFKYSTTAIFVINNTINVKGKIGEREVFVSGSAPHDDYKYLLQFTQGKAKETEKEIEALQKLTIENETKLQEATVKGDSLLVMILRSTKDTLIQKQRKALNVIPDAVESWVVNHKNSYYATYALMYLVQDLPRALKVEQMFLTLPENIKSSYYGYKLMESIESLKISSRIKEGTTIPNLTLIDVNGKEEKLLNILEKDKLTLIDCWASWCSPCRAEIPTLKEIYRAYNMKGLNIVGVSSDKDKGKWLNAIREDKTTWQHYREFSELTLTSIFDLKSIPAYILVNSKGKILAFNCAASSIQNFGGYLRGPELGKTLEKHLN